jgi:hypothetical protein
MAFLALPELDVSSILRVRSSKLLIILWPSRSVFPSSTETRRVVLFDTIWCAVGSAGRTEKRWGYRKEVVSWMNKTIKSSQFSSKKLWQNLCWNMLYLSLQRITKGDDIGCLVGSMRTRNQLAHQHTRSQRKIGGNKGKAHQRDPNLNRKGKFRQATPRR